MIEAIAIIVATDLAVYGLLTWIGRALGPIDVPAWRTTRPPSSR